MKLDRYRKYVRAGVTAFLVLAASMIFYYLLFHQTSVRTAFHNVLNILSPLIAALILAYVISPIINFIEQRIIARLFARHGKTQSVRCKKLVRALLILLTYVSMLFALYGLIATLIPELFSSITNIVSNFSNYANNIQDFATKVLANYPEMQPPCRQVRRCVVSKVRCSRRMWIRKLLNSRHALCLNSCKPHRTVDRMRIFRHY